MSRIELNFKMMAYDVLCLRAFFLIFYLFSTVLYAGPWLFAGEPWSTNASSTTKSDIDLLVSYGLIQAPVLTWPIAWENIGPPLLSDESKEKIKAAPTYLQLAYLRIVSQYRLAITTDLKLATFAIGGGNINPFRTFDYQPRSDFNTGGALEKQGLHWASELAVSYGNYADVTHDVHLDDSYLYGFLGNWGIGVDKMPRWWSPAYSDSLILSANAPALPTITIQRMRAQAFQTKWLKWIGPWSLTTSLSVGGENVPVPHPLIWLTNLSFRPIESLQFSISRIAFFAGDTRPINNPMLINLLIARDNCTPTNHADPNYCQLYSPGTEHVEFTLSWSPYKLFSHPTTFYLHTIFNDGHLFFGVRMPWRTSFLAGSNTIFPFLSGYLRAYIEYEYLIQNAYWLWNISDSYTKKIRITDIYGYSPYPYVYYDKIIGSPLGGESKAINLGGIYSAANGKSNIFLLRYLMLNPWGYSGIGYPFQHQDLLWFSVERLLALPHGLGQLSGQLGYMKSINGAGLKSAPSGFVTWTKSF